MAGSIDPLGGIAEGKSDEAIGVDMASEIPQTGPLFITEMVGQKEPVSVDIAGNIGRRERGKSTGLG
ncbi:hypothetical protein M8C21_015109 [Ambrosia artemisiifolia]|uniref:Uncharacterized protein n=1 Tax=Ambrosia artemisiifolia TaxID=4212 RepID=A0AAD5CSS6_AMBAR|nr:hypothetical protein M8C21_015109 [Ambrosia artemisiifolia]